MRRRWVFAFVLLAVWLVYVSASISGSANYKEWEAGNYIGSADPETIGEVPVFDGFIVVSYNVENFFDTINDPNTDDDEFTPEGERHWNSYRYRNKLTKIWKALAATNLLYFPDVIGLCEVENRNVLEDLALKSYLRMGNYTILHKDSPDRRGIDLAMLYNADKLEPLDSAFFTVEMDGEPDFSTRQILYMKCAVRATGDTLHIFLNHWPSRYGGNAWTTPYRKQAARVLRAAVDDVFAADPGAKVLCMGDFNDTPFDESVMVDLGAESDLRNPRNGVLYNVSYYLSKKKGMWSYWYQGKGDLLDQVMVSGSMLMKKGLHLNPDNVVTITEPGFFDKEGRPWRTYRGPLYLGGFSDHLPIIINIDLE